jgi:uncharacterized membrane protein
MQNIAIMLTLLLVPYWGLIPTHVSESFRGRLGLALVFLFTALGHFVKTSEMAQMLPSWVPIRLPLFYFTGAFELLAAVGLLVPSASRWVGMGVCIFLVLILPSNFYAAFQRVDFGGHGAGPIYLLVRVPFQFFLLGWVYWFAVRQ